MPFKKGHNLSKGRPISSKNEKTKQWEELGHSLITRHSERANQIMSDSDDETFMDNFHKLLEYFKPKLARQDLDIKSDGERLQSPILNIVPPTNH